MEGSGTAAREVAAAGSTCLQAFLFTDIIGSTALKQRVGDAEGARRIALHNASFRRCIERFGGQEQDNAGDGFFATFSVPSAAVHAALAFQAELASQTVESRMGIHMGEAVLIPAPGGGVQFSGLAVDTAARVMGLAEGNQILVTRHAFDSARQQVQSGPGDRDVVWLAHGAYLFHGLATPIDIHEVGLPGLAPLRRPADTGKAHKAQGDDAMPGWRPSRGQPVPGRSPWRLHRKLGEGGFGEAWLAVSDHTKEQRAFKFCFQADRIRHLQRELTLFRALREELGERPDIARLYDVRLDSPPYFLEMEYTPDGSLDRWSQDDPAFAAMGLDARAGFVAEVAEALAAAHSVGILHKDVNPSNVLVRRDASGHPHARLTDFGIGQVLEPERLAALNISMKGFSQRSGELPGRESSGTHMFMAPELFMGHPATLASDVYALGVLLHQVVTGRIGQPMAHGWEQEVPDPLLAEDIAACVHGDPARRPPSAALVAERLRSLEQRRDQRRRLQRQVRRRRLVRQGLLMLAIAGAYLALYGVQEARREALLAHQGQDLQAAQSRTEQVFNELLEAARQRSSQEAILARAAELVQTSLSGDAATTASRWLRLGRACHDCRRHQEAIRYLARAVGLLEQEGRAATADGIAARTLWADCHRSMADALRALNRTDEAASQLEQALEVRAPLDALGAKAGSPFSEQVREELRSLRALPPRTAAPGADELPARDLAAPQRVKAEPAR